MKALAQLPTPTIATRTLPSSAWRPLPAAPLAWPLVSLMRKAVLSVRVAGYEGGEDYPRIALWLHIVGASERPAAARSLELAPRTCQTRWPTVNAVSPAIA